MFFHKERKKNQKNNQKKIEKKGLLLGNSFRVSDTGDSLAKYQVLSLFHSPKGRIDVWELDRPFPQQTTTILFLFPQIIAKTLIFFFCLLSWFDRSSLQPKKNQKNF